MIRIIVNLIVFVLLIIIFFFIYSTITEYSPEKVTPLEADSSKCDVLSSDSTFRFLIWNIGYAGLNQEMDFFYDGGHMVRPSQSKVVENLTSIQSFLKENASVDFCMLQEVDVNSKRSYYINQRNSLQETLQYKYSYLGMNYNVGYVPMPITEPMGHVEAGLLSLTNLKPYECNRMSYPFNFKWPLRLFLLDRCFMPMRYKVSNGKDLIIINTHNSAFDDQGKLRIAELNYLKDYLISEYEHGNYVVVGGDFNQSPVGVKHYFEGEIFDDKEFISVSDSLLPQGWQYVFDNTSPSNRRTDTIYVKGQTRVALLDFFIVSPNICVDNVKCHNLHFVHSDHNPVEMTIRLK